MFGVLEAVVCELGCFEVTSWRRSVELRKGLESPSGYFPSRRRPPPPHLPHAHRLDQAEEVLGAILHVADLGGGGGCKSRRLKSQKRDMST
jgi:hypothetical protein